MDTQLTGDPEPEAIHCETGNSPVRYTHVRSLNRFRGAVSSDNLLVETPGEQSCHTHNTHIRIIPETGDNVQIDHF